MQQWSHRYHAKQKNITHEEDALSINDLRESDGNIWSSELNELLNLIMNSESVT